MQAKDIYADVFNVIGSQHIYPALALSRAAELDKEVEHLLKTPPLLRETLFNINVTLSNRYQKNVALPYLLQPSSATTLYECYVQLTLIPREEQKAHEINFLKNKATPDYEQLYCQKSPIHLSQLWDNATYERKSSTECYEISCEKNLDAPRRLVIRGAAGMGKTTMLRAIAAYWGKGQLKENLTVAVENNTMDLSSWYTHFTVLLHVPLRELLAYEALVEENVSHLSSDEKVLGQWLAHAYPHLTELHVLVLMLCLTRSASLEAFHLPRVLLLLDGLDEVSGLLDSFIPSTHQTEAENAQAKRYHEKRQQVLQILLDSQDWLVTTRPHLADHPKLSSATHHLALTGLKTKQINQYIEHFYQTFAPQKSIESVTSWFHQPHVHDLACIPLQLELLCSMALEKENVLEVSRDISLTELYTDMLLSLSKRFLKSYPHYLSEYETVEDLSKEEWAARCAEPLIWLSELAFGAMLSRKTEFSFNSLRHYPAISKLFSNTEPATRTGKLKEVLNGFGFLTPIGITKNSLYEQLFYFQHLTYQEFLAALALARQLIKSDCDKRHSLLEAIQDPFYHRMQIFLIGMLSDKHTLQLCLNQVTASDFVDLVEEILNAALEAGEGERFLNTMAVSFASIESLIGAPADFEIDENLIQHVPFIPTVEQAQPLKSLLPLVEASLPSNEIEETPILRVCHSAKRILNKVVEITEAQLHRLSPSSTASEITPLPGLTRRLLNTSILKKCIDSAWVAHPENLLIWIGQLTCALPSYLEEKLQTAAQTAKWSVLAVQSIGYLGPYASPSLQTTLEEICRRPSTKMRVRIAATEAIGYLGLYTQESLEAVLTELCSSTSTPVKIAAAKAVLNLGEYASEMTQLKLIDLLKDKNINVRKAVAEMFRFSQNANTILQSALAQLSETPNYEIRIITAEAIKNLNLHVNIDLFMKLMNFLKDENYEVQKTATDVILFLKQHHKSELFQTELISLLTHKEPYVRRNGRGVLKKLTLPIKDTVQLKLIELLKDVNLRNDIRIAAAKAIKFLGRQQLSESLQYLLLELLQDKEIELQQVAQKIIGTLSFSANPSKEPFLYHNKIQDNSQDWESMAKLQQNENNGTKEAFHLGLVKLLSEKNSLYHTKIQAIIQDWKPIAQKTFQITLDNLCKALEPALQITAAKAIGNLGNCATDAIQDSLALLCDSMEFSVRLAAVEAIVSLDNQTSPNLQLKLIGLIKDPDVNIRRTALNMIENLGVNTYEPLQLEIIDLLKDKNDEVKEVAKKAICNFRNYATAAFYFKLFGLLEDEDFEVRQLAQMKFKNIREPVSDVLYLKLIDLLKNKDFDIQNTAQQAVTNLGYFASEKVESILVVLLKDEKDPGTQQVALKALQNLGSQANEETKKALEYYQYFSSISDVTKTVTEKKEVNEDKINIPQQMSAKEEIKEKKSQENALTLRAPKISILNALTLFSSSFHPASSSMQQDISMVEKTVLM